MHVQIPKGSTIAAALVARSSAAKGAPQPRDTGREPSHVLVTRQVDKNNRVTLVFAGVLDASTVGQMRDAAFTEIGPRPKQLCLDLTDAGVPDINAINALVTIANVARMVAVPFCVRVSPPFAAILQQTLLSSIVPIDEGSIGATASKTLCV